MENALVVLVGPEAKGLSASTVARLKRQWAEQYTEWQSARLDKDRWVYIWADGIYNGLRAEDAKYPKAVRCLQKDRAELMAFYNFPAQHWQSLRTTNPIESTFATIRHRTKRSKGCLSRGGMLHMMFKLAECAQKNWRRQRGVDYLAKVIAGVKFKDGIEVTTDNQDAA